MSSSLHSMPNCFQTAGEIIETKHNDDSRQKHVSIFKQQKKQEEEEDIYCK